MHREAESGCVWWCWNIQDSGGDEWPLLGAFNQCYQSTAPPGERLMGTGYFIRPSTSLPRIWGCNCVCFCCCFVLQADKEEPTGWSLGRGSQGAIRSGRTRSRKGKRVKRAWRFSSSMTHRTVHGELNWKRNIFISLLTWCVFLLVQRYILNPNLDLVLWTQSNTVRINKNEAKMKLMIILQVWWSTHRLFTLMRSFVPSSINWSDCSDGCGHCCFYQQPFPSGRIVLPHPFSSTVIPRVRN